MSIDSPDIGYKLVENNPTIGKVELPSRSKLNIEKFIKFLNSYGKKKFSIGSLLRTRRFKKFLSLFQDLYKRYDIKHIFENYELNIERSTINKLLSTIPQFVDTVDKQSKDKLSDLDEYKRYQLTLPDNQLPNIQDNTVPKQLTSLYAEIYEKFTAIKTSKSKLFTSAIEADKRRKNLSDDYKEISKLLNRIGYYKKTINGLCSCGNKQLTDNSIILKKIKELHDMVTKLYYLTQEMMLKIKYTNIDTISTIGQALIAYKNIVSELFSTILLARQAISHAQLANQVLSLNDIKDNTLSALTKSLDEAEVKSDNLKAQNEQTKLKESVPIIKIKLKLALSSIEKEYKFIDDYLIKKNRKTRIVVFYFMHKVALHRIAFIIGVITGALKTAAVT
ncbi:MAG: hypothetical protein NkDv07_0776 [Candidatus Improbicoccus devescovinae]|nr:MAG: hypothetical protein NkDv07_0776 [Candidatus Improbicoccus devescovinae]